MEALRKANASMEEQLGQIQAKATAAQSSRKTLKVISSDLLFRSNSASVCSEHALPVRRMLVKVCSH